MPLFIVCKSKELKLTHHTIGEMSNNLRCVLGLGTSSPASIPKPSCVKTLKANGGVRLAACGKAHTLAVAVAGGVYAFGSNADGQLGKGRKIEMSPKPIKIESILFREDAREFPSCTPVPPKPPTPPPPCGYA